MTADITIQREASLTEQVSEAILKLLRGGEFPPGARLTEQTLADRLNVSRTPIREGLNRLVQRDLLEHRRSGGYFVKIFSEGEIRDIMAMRTLLEPAALRIVAGSFDAARLAALDRAIKAEHDAARAEDNLKFADAHQAFRSALFGHVPNRLLRAAIAQFEPHLHFIRIISRVRTTTVQSTLDRQHQLRDALAAGKADLAEILWRHYLEATESWLLEIVRGGQASPAKPAGARNARAHKTSARPLPRKPPRRR